MNGEGRIASLLKRVRAVPARRLDLAAERERARIAKDMHDVLAHAVSLMVVQAEAGPVVVRGDPDRAEATFDAVAASAPLGVARGRSGSRHEEFARRHRRRPGTRPGRVRMILDAQQNPGSAGLSLVVNAEPVPQPAGDRRQGAQAQG
ncbi:histidine kinase [Nonomuraea sp. NPDC003754]